MNTSTIGLNPRDPQLESDLSYFQHEILQHFLYGYTLILLADYFIAAYLVLSSSNTIIFLILTLYLGLNFALTFLPKLSYTTRATGVVISISIMALFATRYQGIFTLGALLFTLALQSAIFFLAGRRRSVMVITVLGMTALAIGGAAYSGFGLFTPAPLPELTPQTVAVIETYLLINILLGVLFTGIKNQVNQTTEKSSQAQTNLMLQREQMERTIYERTAQMEHQANLFKATLMVTTQIAMATNREDLFHTTIQSISDNFGFYHVGIFLLDKRQEFAVLTAASEGNGQQMLANGHRLRKGQVGIVGFVTGTGASKISTDVQNDPTYFRNPLLPLTQSEAAFPLMSEGTVVGALDIQSTLINAFNEIEAGALETIANQFSSTYQQIQLSAQLKKSFSDQAFRTRMETSQAWKKQSLQSHGFHYQAQNDRIEPLSAATRMPTSPAENTIDIPIQVHGVPISRLRVSFANSKIPLDVQKMLMEAADRIGTALDNARLLEELGRRVNRERMINDMNALIRSSSSVDQILKNAAAQLSTVTGADQARIQLVDLSRMDNEQYSEEIE